MIGKLTDQNFVCPWWLCFSFDNPLRRLLHDPDRMLGAYVRPGHSVIDVGCGMGYFTIPLARQVGPAGRVTAIDLQEKMLSVVVERARRGGVAETIRTHLALPGSLGDHEQADFILAFWMAHEVPDQGRFFSQIRKLLKPEGLFLLVEPLIHVSRKNFLRTLKTANALGSSSRIDPISASAAVCCWRQATPDGRRAWPAQPSLTYTYPPLP